MNNEANGNQPNVVPFGKYKGQPAEVLAADPKYVEWLNGQGWVKDKYPKFYTVIINNLQEPSDTPEHNALQALFLDDDLCVRFLSSVLIIENAKNDSWFVKIISKQFEVNGVDVLIHHETFSLEHCLWRHSHNDYFPGGGIRNQYNMEESIYSATRPSTCGIEIKPSIGDDFPAVLRQAMNMHGVNQRCVLFRDFVATSVTLDQVRAMFALSMVYLFSLAEVQNANPDTRFDEWIESHGGR